MINGLTQSAAARVVGSMHAAGLVERRPGGGRSVPVGLTPAGRRAVRALVAARRDALGAMTSVLDDSERQELARLLSKVLAQLFSSVGDTDLMCRLCDRRACTTGAECPVGAAQRHVDDP